MLCINRVVLLPQQLVRNALRETGLSDERIDKLYGDRLETLDLNEILAWANEEAFWKKQVCVCDLI